MHDMVNDVENGLDKHKNVLCEIPRYELRHWKASNPEVLCLYVMIKIHKEPDADGDRKARPVESNINTPTEKIAKKLVKIFGKFPMAIAYTELAAVSMKQNCFSFRGIVYKKDEEIHRRHFRYKK